MLTRASGPGAMRIEELLNQGAEFDAIFAACDVAAVGAMHALQKLGRTIPGDVADRRIRRYPGGRLSSAAPQHRQTDSRGRQVRRWSTLSSKRSNPARSKPSPFP